jgi:hypothetical protein
MDIWEYFLYMSKIPMRYPQRAGVSLLNEKKKGES